MGKRRLTVKDLIKNTIASIEEVENHKKQLKEIPCDIQQHNLPKKSTEVLELLQKSANYISKPN